MIPEDIIELCWQKLEYVFYNPKTNSLICCEFQRWVDEGNKVMVSIHNKERCTREDIFLKSHIFIGEMGYKKLTN